MPRPVQARLAGECATRRIAEKFGIRCEGSTQGLLVYRLEM